MPDELPTELRDLVALFWMDNLSVLSGLCPPAARWISGASCMLLLWRALRGASCPGGISDAGTRARWEVFKAAGIPFEERPSPAWPEDTLEAGPEVWLEWLRGAA